jgi:hypothetical protein
MDTEGSTTPGGTHATAQEIEHVIRYEIETSLLWCLPRAARDRAVDELLVRARTSPCPICHELGDVLYLIDQMGDLYAQPDEIAAIFPWDEADILQHLVHRLIEKYATGANVEAVESTS